MHGVGTLIEFGCWEQNGDALVVLCMFRSACRSGRCYYGGLLPLE